MDIRQYFSKPLKRKAEGDDEEVRSEGFEAATSSSSAICRADHPKISTIRHTESNEKFTDSGAAIFDIFAYTKQVPQHNLMEVFDQIWVPDEGFVFKASGKRNLKFQLGWLKRFNWLTYSKEAEGAFCKVCVFFGKKVGGVGAQVLYALVTRPFTNWKDAIESFGVHHKNKYHQDAVMFLERRRNVQNGIELPVSLQLESQNAKTIKENRENLMPIVETILLCGRQGLPLRGTSNYTDIRASDPTANEGNFRALIRFRSNVDSKLANHLESCKSNAKYLSHRVQNELIQCAGTLISKKIVEAVSASRIFSVLADETADISGTEQMSIVVRYFEESTKSVREDFLAFVPMNDCSGESLASGILSCLKSHGINCEFLVGQGYDGARAMSGRFHGAQANIKKLHKMALYVHCASHSLNLAVSEACEVPQIRNCLGTIEAAYVFFNTPKRGGILKKLIEQDGGTRKSRLTQLCRTRWVEKHEAVGTFVELQPFVIKALEEISGWVDSKTSSSADRLHKAIFTAEFQISCQIIVSVHSIIIPLSKTLQNSTIDLAFAVDLAKCAHSELLQIRESADVKFKTIFRSSINLCETYDVEIKIPRNTKRQIYRSNPDVNTAEDYYRISIFLPFIETFLVHLNDRFLQHEQILKGFQILMPNGKIQSDEDILNAAHQLYTTYISLLDCTENELVGSIKIWRRFLSEENIETDNAIKSLQACNNISFRPVYDLLKVLVVIPVTTASNERAFSTLRRLKNYLRNSMAEHRLNGLAHLNIHREIKLTATEVIDEFAKQPRRLLFL